MINTKDFFNYLNSHGLEFYVGVPDSLLANLYACIEDNCGKNNNIIAANEGNAVAIAAGYHLATSKIGIVYMQNSGIGNAVNPLLSLIDEEVYKIPMLLLIGWRGEPNTEDEPQHKKQGIVTEPLLSSMDIKTIILSENYKQQINECINYMVATEKAAAVIIKKDTFSPYANLKIYNPYTLNREKALEIIINSLSDDDFIVSTTGKSSREIFEIRKKNLQTHSHDFLTVGSMGHAASLAFGVSINSDKNIFCIDGDGAFLMHMGGLAIIAQNADKNFNYILINNGSHESTGGQPTVGFNINIKKILEAFGFKNIYTAEKVNEVKNYITRLKENKDLSALIINTGLYSRKDLGRPELNPKENKAGFMKALQS